MVLIILWFLYGTIPNFKKFQRTKKVTHCPAHTMGYMQVSQLKSIVLSSMQGTQIEAVAKMHSKIPNCGFNYLVLQFAHHLYPLS